MNNLSKREKVLLYFLALIVILAGGICLLLLPLAERSQAVQETLFAQQLWEQEIRITIENEASMTNSISGLEDKLQNYQNTTYPYMAADEVDAMLTTMLASYSLKPLSLTLGDEQLAAIPPYGSLASDGTVVPGTYPTLLSRDANITVAGSLGDFMRFVDAAAKNTSLQVWDCTATQSEAGSFKINANLTVYLDDHES